MIIKKSLPTIILLALGLVCSHAQAQEPSIMPKQDPTPGYLVVSGWYKDSSVQKTYLEKVGPIIAQHDFVTAKIGVPGKNLRVIEGTWTPRPFSLMQFKSEAAVKKFWTSKEYQNEAKPVRVGESAIDVIKAGAAFGHKAVLEPESALLIFFVDIRDREKLMKQYVPKAPALVARFGGEYVISSAQWGMELLEGSYPSESIVVVKFPSADALTSFWNDEDYKKLSEIRKSTGKWSVVEIMPFNR